MKYKHKNTISIAYLDTNGYYTLESNPLVTIPRMMVENSNDWELVQEIPEYVTAIIGGHNSGKSKEPKGYENETRIYKVLRHEPKWSESYNGSYVVDSDGKELALYVTYTKKSSKELFDKQELQNSIKNMKHGEWYKVSSSDNHWLIKFNKNTISTIRCLKKKCITREELSSLFSESSWGRFEYVKSLSPATQQEVEQYFPNEFRKPLFVTEDKVEVFNGDTFYWINVDTLKIIESVANDTKFKSTYTHPLFKIRNKAQEYLDSLKPKEETLLEKAKRLYPVGTIHKGQTGTGKYKVTNSNMRCQGFDSIYSGDDQGCIHSNNKWAEIIQPDVAKLDMKEYSHPVDEKQFTPMQLATIQQMIDERVEELKQLIKNLQ